MAISKKEAEKRYEEALNKKGYQAKLTDNYLVIVGGGRRVEEEIK